MPMGKIAGGGNGETYFISHQTLLLMRKENWQNIRVLKSDG